MTLTPRERLVLIAVLLFIAIGVTVRYYRHRDRGDTLPAINRPVPP